MVVLHSRAVGSSRSMVFMVLTWRSKAVSTTASKLADLVLNLVDEFVESCLPTTKAEKTVRR